MYEERTRETRGITQIVRFVRTKVREMFRLKLALRLVWQSASGLTLANAGCILLQGPLPLLSLYVLKRVIDAVTTGVVSPDQSGALKTIGFSLTALASVKLVENLVSLLARLVNEAQSQVVTDYVQDRLHAKSIEVDLSYYEQAEYYNTLHRAQQEGSFRPISIINNLIQLGCNGLSLLAMLGLVSTLHWGGVIILFVTILPQVWPRVSYAQRHHQWQRERTATTRESWYVHWILTSKEHAKELRIFGIGDVFRQRFRKVQQQLRREKFHLIARHAIREFGAQMLTMLIMFSAYALLLYRTMHGMMTPGDLIMYYQAFQRGQSFLRGGLRNLSQLYEDNLFLSHLYEFLDLVPIVRNPTCPIPFPTPIRRSIVFDHVNFRYPGSEQNALTDVSLEIRAGEKIALVGENGAGKTTLIKLLCRLYDPSAGVIFADGLDLREYELASLRRELSIIFQDYVRYNVTARENIWLGNIAYARNDPRIFDAARYAGADDVIAGLPKGYETRLGKWFEGGEELSEGQWQKIALARAFLRDAQILVLDEPTSAMDAKAEYDLFCRFRQLTENRTAILISHRFSTVRMADRIYVLSKGMILEEGSHDELMRSGGTYARMFEMQAQHYR